MASKYLGEEGLAALVAVIKQDLVGGYEIGHGLKIVDGTLTVNSVSDFSGDNTLPMTAAGVQEAIGKIETLLGTI